MLATEIQEGLYKEVVELVSPKGKEFRLPRKAITNSEFRNFLPKLVEAACDHRSIPDEVPKELRSSLEPFLKSLTGIIADEGDSVWTWYILNTLGPSSLAERKVDRILANPPWVRASNIQVKNRKKEVESMAKKLELWVGGKNATGFDIAALFIHRCRNLYLDEQMGKAAWITNNAAIRGGNWEGFHKRHGKFLTRIIDYGELKEQPFHGAKSCALIEDGASKSKTELSKLVNAQGRISRHQRWAEIRDATYLEEQTLEKLIPKAESKYFGKFKNGATIFPHCLLVVESMKLDKEENQKVRITTKKSRHLPWKNIESPKEMVPKRWIVSCIFSDDLLPFALRPETTQALIPLGENGLLEKNPEKELYWSKSDKSYKENRGIGKATPETLLSRINFGSALQKQLPITNPEHDLRKVVYNEAGQHLRAARYSSSKFMVEHACYWFEASSEQEAQYLVSLLNAECLQAAYRECRKSDRHFDTHIWNGVPIPYYDPENNLHKKLANLCVEAEKHVAELIPNLDLNYRQEKLSKEIKNALRNSGVSDQIDEVVKKVLPKQAR